MWSQSLCRRLFPAQEGSQASVGAMRELRHLVHFHQPELEQSQYNSQCPSMHFLVPPMYLQVTLGKKFSSSMFTKVLMLNLSLKYFCLRKLVVPVLLSYPYSGNWVSQVDVLGLYLLMESRVGLEMVEEEVLCQRGLYS
jgi:hypothetical protein